LSELVDWGLARRVAIVAAGEDGGSPSVEVLESAVERAERAVEDYTGLEPEEDLPAPEWVSRCEWAELSLESMRDTLAPFERRLGHAAGPTAALAAPLAGALAIVAGAQLGALVGYASRRVLGQYEFPIADAERPPRLLFVGANVERATADLGDDPDALLGWIALHEVTHAVQLGATPWLREHLRGLVEELLEESRIGIGWSEIAAAARRVAGSDPRGWIAELGSSDPLTLLTAADSRRALERTQATMAAVEGYAEHVMDAAAPLLGEDVSDLRAAVDRRREQRPPLARVLSWLLGMELKLRQYRDGKRFCDETVRLAGVEALNAAWGSPEALPTPAELSDPPAWLRRRALSPA
jgi:coenzyme F420 biosynthesis associated uncharacterized protein